MFKTKSLILALSVAAATPALSFELKSPDIPPGGAINQKHVFKGFGCTGENMSPALTWSEAPAGTKSFALMVHDPDAPTGGAGFWHWVVIDIPATANMLPPGVLAEGKGLPEGAKQIATDFGAPGWGGPCPPAGDAPHHYNFTLYALKVDKLPVPANATASLTGFMVNGNSIGKATLTGLYGR